jgi:hypothetical protein
MAALAQALEIAQPVVSRVVIEMGRGQDDSGVPALRGFNALSEASI